VSAIGTFLLWVLGIVLDPRSAKSCVVERSGYELCVGGGNPVPLGLDKEYFPVTGTDVAVTVQRKF
jgi:hypothetical protein